VYYNIRNKENTKQTKKEKNNGKTGNVKQITGTGYSRFVEKLLKHRANFKRMNFSNSCIHMHKGGTNV
jgi:hypothetical protein